MVLTPCPLQYTLVQIYFMHSSLHPLIPCPDLSLPLAFPRGNHQFVFYVCLWVCFCFAYTFICVIFRSHIEWYHAGFFLSSWIFGSPLSFSLSLHLHLSCSFVSHPNSISSQQPRLPCLPALTSLSLLLLCSLPSSSPLSLLTAFSLPPDFFPSLWKTFPTSVPSDI